MPKILNKYHSGVPEGSVYIGRGSPYGNPFKIGEDGTRVEVIEKFRRYVFNNKELLNLIRTELPGKDLVCYCAPKKCHGDIILEIANGNAILDELVRIGQENGEYS